MLVHALETHDKVNNICKKNKIILIEDTCEARNNFSSFSFYYSHHNI